MDRSTGDRPRLLTADRVGLALAAAVVLLAAVANDDPATGRDARELDALAVLIVGVSLASTLFSRRFPGTVAVFTLLCTFAWYGVGYTSGLIHVPTLIAFYRLGASEGQRRKVLVAAATISLVLLNVGLLADDGWSEALAAAGYLVVAVLVGELVRSRHLLLEQYARRAEQAEIAAERRVVEERLRIARDLHDVLAHTVSAMTVQAGVAADELDRDPEAARRALLAVRRAGREAMGEVQATVEVLRTPTDERGTATAAGQGATGGFAPAGDRSPAPRLDQLDALASASREQGLDVEVATELSGRALPEVVELTAYRIVQESLTNVVRHADAGSAVVTISERPDALTVEVRDDGRGGEPTEAGFGLRGMAERVEALGGRLWHGGRPDGGWVVRASLPLASVAS